MICSLCWQLVKLGEPDPGPFEHHLQSPLSPLPSCLPLLLPAPQLCEPGRREEQFLTQKEKCEKFERQREGKERKMGREL